jgi:anti-sigma B factor antagonist
MANAPVATIDDNPEALVVRVQADGLSEDQLRELQSLVRTAAEGRAGQACILDLGQVTFIPSLSLAALIRMHSELQGRGQRLLLAAVQPRVREVIVMTRLDRLFELHDDLEGAKRAAGLV